MSNLRSYTLAPLVMVWSLNKGPKEEGGNIDRRDQIDDISIPVNFMKKMQMSLYQKRAVN